LPLLLRLLLELVLLLNLIHHLLVSRRVAALTPHKVIVLDLHLLEHHFDVWVVHQKLIVFASHLLVHNCLVLLLIVYTLVSLVGVSLFPVSVNFL